ncbi:MAG: RNA 2'-phosphotransferase [Lactobacillus sp.]|jgi:putative RNA 2'-phosphotransferase|nr:RNA 2'-phosphotransferase [Lactobacillus sp.]
MDKQFIKISKRLSLALRHHPERLGLKLDAYGRVDLDQLLAHYNAHYQQPIDEGVIRQIMAQSDKQRFAIEAGQIRALYGHSVPVQLLQAPADPPAVLYHGTTHGAAIMIAKEGLRKMDRDFVHLSATIPMARSVGQRREAHPVIYQVAAQHAAAAGLLFYPTKSQIWLVDHVPAQYLTVWHDK